MIRIIKSREPKCLTKLKEDENNCYDNLQDKCLTITRQLLFKDQKGLCAYCQSVFKFTVYIEHFIAQSVDDSKELDYSNFLGVCSGKYYLDKKTGKHIEYCSRSRGNKELFINPELNSCISTIYYDEKNKIRSNNRQYDSDINVILNLNFKEICDDRNKAFNNLIKSIFDLGLNLNLTKLDIYRKAIISLNNKPIEFVGFLVYKLQKLIDFHLSN
ncbi:MAG: hypothetical protein KAS71_12465 [Bacteroidales bacterium]|nr:hypothetical protein [Bacteroidales bacterium]